MGAALAFYRDLLGLEVVDDDVLSGEALDAVVGVAGARIRCVELRLPDGLLIELLQYERPEPSGGRPPAQHGVGAHHLSFLVEDIHVEYERLQRAGVRFTSPPVEINGGVFARTWTTYCFDPDSLAVELWQPPRAHHVPITTGGENA